ncbi:MAG TPA: hypothetical protein VGD40_20665 [Chryseosolibacter sp.]
MKRLATVFSRAGLVMALATVSLIISCKSDEPTLSNEQRVTKILTENGGKWNLPSVAGVTVDGLDVTQDLFKDFSITFGDGTLTTTGTTPVWLRQDTWSFKDESASVIIRGQDNKEITISEITADELVLTLQWDEETFEGGRSKSIKGTHQFVLQK